MRIDRLFRVLARLGLACAAAFASAAAASSPSPASLKSDSAAKPPALHYRTVGYEFDAPHASWMEGNPPPRRVEWSYPVIVGPGDRATAALNAWIRRQALTLLLAKGPLRQLAEHLTDREVIARAIKDPGFIDSELDQAEIVFDNALGIYRTFTFHAETEGGPHPDHGLEVHLYNLRSGREQAVQELYKDDDVDLDALYDEQNKSPAHPCEHRHFDWQDAGVAAADRIFFEYAPQPGWDPECDSASISGPQVSRMLRSPSDLAPVFQLSLER